MNIVYLSQYLSQNSPPLFPLGDLCWRGSSLKTQATCPEDRMKPNAAVETICVEKQSIFSTSQCKCIHHTNSWRTSAGLMGINHIQGAKTDTA